MAVYGNKRNTKMTGEIAVNVLTALSCFVERNKDPHVLLSLPHMNIQIILMRLLSPCQNASGGYSLDSLRARSATHTLAPSEF